MTSKKNIVYPLSRLDLRRRSDVGATRRFALWGGKAFLLFFFLLGLSRNRYIASSRDIYMEKYAMRSNLENLSRENDVSKLDVLIDFALLAPCTLIFSSNDWRLTPRAIDTTIELVNSFINDASYLFVVRCICPGVRRIRITRYERRTVRFPWRNDC